MLKVLDPLVSAGKVKIYSCDSVAGQAMMDRNASPAQKMWMMNQFHQYIKHEVVPAIRTDCNNPEVAVWSAGASIGAFHAAAMVCRFPDLFHRGICMSGTYDLMRFLGAKEPTADFFVSSPVHFVPTLEGMHLDLLRQRMLLIASGEGRYEDISESWNLAKILGRKGIPNWVDSWGPEVHHDWMTWREMLPKYLGEWTQIKE
jgi:esterase/lipase superfamily enzyme